MVNMENSLLIICGLHRSGTTYIGEVLRRGGAHVIHEPLNPSYGVGGVPCAYPYVGEQGGIHAALIDGVLALNQQWGVGASMPNASGLQRTILALTGGRRRLLWDLMRLRSSLGLLPKNVCLKDPFLTLAIPYILASSECRVVCMIRHPAAIHVSTNRRGWSFNIENLRAQKEFVTDIGSEIMDQMMAISTSDRAASIAVLWMAAVQLMTQLARNDERLLFVKHEEFCVTPVSKTIEIFRHLRVPMSKKVVNYVSKTTMADSPARPSGRTHDFNRNSRLIPDAWRTRISQEDEKILRSIAGRRVRELYGSW